jgi:hypothetical protein
VLEGADPSSVSEFVGRLHDGDRGSVWGIDLGRAHRAWQTTPCSSAERGIVLSLAVGCQGRAKIGLRVAEVDMGVLEIGCGDSCFVPLELGHVWMTQPEEDERGWRYRTLLVVVPWVQPRPGEAISVEGWLASRKRYTKAVVLCYGDSWRYAKGASLARISG